MLLNNLLLIIKDKGEIPPWKLLLTEENCMCGEEGSDLV